MKLWDIMFVIMVISAFIFLFANEGRITIEKNYYDQYQSCQSQVKELQNSVQCPDVKCDCGIQGIIYTAMGFIFMCAGYFLFFTQLNKKKGKK